MSTTVKVTDLIHLDPDNSDQDNFSACSYQEVDKVIEDTQLAQGPMFEKDQDGLLRLYDLMDDGTESVTNIREAAIQNEIERKTIDENEKYALEAFIARKEVEALEEYKRIDEKWGQIQRLKDPLNIHNETISQREKCSALLREKDNVIEYLKETLKKKDESFLKDVEQQGLEVDLLIDRIEQQITTLKEAYTNQLESLEVIIDEEKRMMVETNRGKWHKLLQNKDEVDKLYLQKLLNLVDTHEKTMEITEKEQNESKKNIRLNLDRIINDLIAQNDSLKSICILNVDKMTYNYQLLLKKQKENQSIKQHCKKYISKLGNTLAKLKIKIENSNRKISSLLVQNASKLDKLGESISSIKERRDTLALANSKIYFDLWSFNEREAEKLLNEIIAYDKILYEEVLFTTWEPFLNMNEERYKPPCVTDAMKLLQELRNRNKLKSKEFQRKLNQSNYQPEKLYKVVLDALKSSCSYLIEQNKKDNIGHLVAQDKYLLEMGNILEALGVKSDKSLKLLIDHFVAYVTCPECEAESSDVLNASTMGKNDDLISTDNSEMFPRPRTKLGEPEILDLKDENLFDDKLHSTTKEGCVIDVSTKMCIIDDHHPFINPLDVHRALNDFTRNLNERKTNFDLEEISQKASPLGVISLGSVTDYWQSYIKPFNSEKVEFWDTMIVSVQHYHKALHKRNNLKNEVNKLKKTNYDLRRLLQRFVQNSK